MALFLERFLLRERVELQWPMVYTCKELILHMNCRYLKYYCNTTLSWGEDGTGDHISIPDMLPSLPNPWKQEV